MRIALHALLALAIAVVLSLPGSMSAERPVRYTEVELSADFNAPDGTCGTLFKICTDGRLYTSNRLSKSYPNNVLFTSSGDLYLRIQRNQKLRFVFDTPARAYPVWPNQNLVCRSYSLNAYTSDDDEDWGLSAPAFLNASGFYDAVFTSIRTGAQFVYQNGTWTSQSHVEYTFPLQEETRLPVGETVYVAMNAQIHTYDPDTTLGFQHNSSLWSTVVPYTGIVMVTHPDVNTWEVEPLPPDVPNAPLRALGPNEAGLRVISSGPGQSGYCDLGDWVMPFHLTLRRVNPL